MELNSRPEFRQLEALNRLIRQKQAEYTESVQRDESGGRTAPSLRSVSLLEELQVLGTAYGRELIAVQTAFGFSESELQQYEKLELDAVLNDREERYSRQDIESMYPTATLDESAPAALEKLLPRVDPDWLDREGRTNYRLDDSFLNRPLHIVCGTRVGVGTLGDRPQRFARMLLLCRDHVNKRDELDFFEAALAVPEIVMLADSLSQIDELGPVATTQLERLPELDDPKAASTMHELLVGSACVRRGKSLKMLSDAGSNKVPDFKVIDPGAPTSIECKRRLGLSDYELAEARHIEELYSGIRELLVTRGLHFSIEATFLKEVFVVSQATFRTDVESLVASENRGLDITPTAWGHLRHEVLPFTLDLPWTRLYSPDFLERVFNWPVLQNAWDGLLCEVEPLFRVCVRSAKNPRCLKWVSLNDKAILKKSRGITSLWGRATKQIPAGEMGIIYIAYPEGARESLADARTQHIIKTSKQWQARWSVKIPMTVVDRLYSRSLGIGLPDLIESSLLFILDGDETWLSMFPANVFTMAACDAPAI